MRFRAPMAAAALTAGWLLLSGLPVAASPTQQGTVDVAQRDNFFDPATITVAAGTTVRWTNHGSNQHTTTSNDGLWDSGTMNPGATFQFTFTTPGTYGFICEFHDELGMTGTVEVTAAPGPTRAPPEPTNTRAPTQAPPVGTSAPTTAPPEATMVPTAPPPPPMDMIQPPAPPKQPPEMMRQNLYLVMPGDTLSELARRFGVSVMDVVVANRIRNPDLIYAGTVLVIPRFAPPRPPVGGGGCVAYRVHYGDTVYALARRFGTTVHAIARVNGINPNRIYAGQRLLICPGPDDGDGYGGYDDGRHDDDRHDDDRHDDDRYHDDRYGDDRNDDG